MTTLNMHHIVDDLAISEGTYSLVRRIEDIVNEVSSTLNVWAARSRDRRHLATLSDRMLDDIGLSRAQVAAETDKYFWQS